MCRGGVPFADKELLRNMKIIALVADLLFESKIVATARAVGASVETTRHPMETAQHVSDARGVLVDLSVAPAETIALIRSVRSMRPELPLIGFAPHVDEDAARAAADAGATAVLTRSQFARRLPELLVSLEAERGASVGSQAGSGDGGA